MDDVLGMFLWLAASVVVFMLLAFAANFAVKVLRNVLENSYDTEGFAGAVILVNFHAVGGDLIQSQYNGPDTQES